jgi:DNA-binding MarR family transcriptional regulator
MELKFLVRNIYYFTKVKYQKECVMSNYSMGWDELLGREFSSAVVLFHQAVAERLGLNATDFKCLDILNRIGPITAGQLATLTNLSGGAITGVIDRLEEAGFVRRERDRKDRRWVIIQPVSEPERARVLAPIFASLRQALEEELAGRYSPETLAAIQDFLHRTIQIIKQETNKLQEKTGSEATY